MPAHQLDKLSTSYGHVGNSGEVRARELARNDAKCPARYHGKVERKRGAEIGLDRRFVYFRHKAMRVTQYIGAKNDANYNDFLKDAKERCRRFDAGAPADPVFAVRIALSLQRASAIPLAVAIPATTTEQQNENKNDQDRVHGNLHFG